MKPSRLDRFVAWLSPTAGNRRARARADLARELAPKHPLLTPDQRDRMEAGKPPRRVLPPYLSRPEP